MHLALEQQLAHLVVDGKEERRNQNRQEDVRERTTVNVDGEEFLPLAVVAVRDIEDIFGVVSH